MNIKVDMLARGINFIVSMDVMKIVALLEAHRGIFGEINRAHKILATPINFQTIETHL